MFFKNFRPFFGPFLDTVVKNVKKKKDAPGCYRHLSNSSKNLIVTVWVIKLGFPKIDIFWAQMSWLVPGLKGVSRGQGGGKESKELKRGAI